MTLMFKGKTAVIIGGGSGMGFRVAQLIVDGGGHVVIGGRIQKRLDGAVEKLGSSASAYTVDNTNKESIAAFFAQVSAFEYLFTPGASYVTGRMLELSDEEAESPFRSKFWGQYWAVKHGLPKLAGDGAIVLMSGAASVRPPPGIGAAPYVACNAAIEGLGRGLAVELAPIRVNVVSPGAIDGSLWRARPAEQREGMFKMAEELTALGRVGTEDEVAQAVIFLFQATYITGSTLYPDGGYALR